MRLNFSPSEHKCSQVLIQHTVFLKSLKDLTDDPKGQCSYITNLALLNSFLCLLGGGW